MKKAISYKKKNQLLIAIIVFAIIVVYNLSIVKTIDKYESYMGLKEQIKTVSMIPQEINVLQNKISTINRFFGDDSDSSINKRELLIDYTSNYCEDNDLSIRLINEPSYEYYDNVLIETNQLILQGQFIQMVKYIDNLEKYQKTGKISSLHFYKEYNTRTKEEKLYLKVFIQNIINHADENKNL